MEGVNDGFEFLFTEVFVEMDNKPCGFVIGGNEFAYCFPDWTCDTIGIIWTEAIKALENNFVVETESWSYIFWFTGNGIESTYTNNQFIGSISFQPPGNTAQLG